MFWRRKKIAEDLKTVTEIAGDQIAPGAGHHAPAAGRGGAGARQPPITSANSIKNKKAAIKAALPKSDKFP